MRATGEAMSSDEQFFREQGWEVDDKEIRVIRALATPSAEELEAADAEEAESEDVTVPQPDDTDTRTNAGLASRRGGGSPQGLCRDGPERAHRACTLDAPHLDVRRL